MTTFRLPLVCVGARSPLPLQWAPLASAFFSSYAAKGTALSGLCYPHSSVFVEAGARLVSRQSGAASLT